MDQLFEAAAVPADASRLSEEVVQHLVGLVGRTSVCERPFVFQVLDCPLPPSLYGTVLAALPDDGFYRPLHHHDARLPDGRSARLQFPLVPANVDRLPASPRALWRAVAKGLMDRRVVDAFRSVFAQPLEAVSGRPAGLIRLRPYATLFRDLGGYKISVHPDSPRKAITMQLYLPQDETQLHLGTLFHRAEDGNFPVEHAMRFAPNSGYAFAVTPDSFHSVSPMRPDDRPRNSLMVIISYDRGPVIEGFKRARGYVRASWDRIRGSDDRGGEQGEGRYETM
jgi:hypothetical protein